MTSETRQQTSAIAAGDPAAFTRFYEERFDAMLAEAGRLTGRDEAFCLDVVQDAMVRVIRRLPVIDEEAALDAWMRRVTLSAAYDRLRREARLRKRERAAAREDVGEGVDERLEEERLVWLRERMAELEPGEAGLIRLRFGVGLTLAKIGALMGLKAGAVDGRIGRSVGAMRKSAGGRGDE